MIPKRKSSTISYRASDMHSSFVYTRKHEALLRSVGHRFRDGRWEEKEDDFFTYSVEEPLCASERFPFTFPAYEQDGEGDFPGSPVPGNFRVTVARGFDSSRYYGSIANRELPSLTEPDFGDIVLTLNALGTAFIVRNRPGNPVLSAGQFFAELRDLPQLPRFLLQRAKKFKDLGSEYLNVEYGWKPFIKDVVALYYGHQRIQRELKKLVANNGLFVRKRSKKELTIDGPVDLCEGSLSEPFGHLGDVSIGGHEELEGYYVGGPTGSSDTDLYSFSGQCDYKLQKTVSTLSWQCGTFQYFVPDIGSDRWTAKARIALSGASLTPSLLYEIVPWSWLIDWFTNVGDIASAMSENAVENESLTNAYSMQSQETLYTVNVSTHWDELLTFPFGSTFHVPAGSASVLYSRKENYKARHQASPFGFGLLRDDFTSRQLAILAALLVSKAQPNRRGSVEQILSYR